MVNPAWIIRAAAVVFADEDARRKLGWIVAAICSPLILTLALISMPRFCFIYKNYFSVFYNNIVKNDF